MKKMSSDLRRCAPGLSVAILVALGFSWGCRGTPGIDEIMETERLEIKEARLTLAALERRIQEIDAAYREPRTPKKVEYSFETAEQSISAANGYAALWRAARACAWLAWNHTVEYDRKRYAKLGIAVGKMATEKLSSRVESYYYYTLSRGAYCELAHCDQRDVRELRDQIKFALSLDDTYDHCGGYRFLGKLIIETVPYPTYALGTVEEGIDLLRKAVQLCPEFAENHLLLAEALIGDEQYVEAYEELQAVLRSSVPPDHSAAHGKWLVHAESLLRKLPESLLDTLEGDQLDTGALEEGVVGESLRDIDGATPTPSGAEFTSGKK